jgi:hypothetical protein
MKHKYFFYFFSCFALPTLIWVDDAFAYLNLAGGSAALLHGLIALITGGIFLIKVYWNKLKKIFPPREKDDISGD